MNVKTQKKLASGLCKRSKKRIKLNPYNLADIKEAITKADIKSLINQKIITIEPRTGVSRGRARSVQQQKNKGRRKGQGSRKGTKNARLNQKRVWINRVRLQRKHIKTLKDKGVLKTETYRELYRKIKGGFFRSKRHLSLYIEEHGYTKK